MYRCIFCGRDDFPSRQSFNAHCRWCDAYLQHKHKRDTASGTSLRQAVPQAQSDQAASPPTLLPNTNDPFAPFRDFLQGVGLQPPGAAGTQETPQQKRRRLLQAAKIHAIDHKWLFRGTVPAELRATARLSIDREMRDEPLEEWTSQEVNELADSIRDRSYNSFLRKQEKEAQRTREATERTRRDRSEEERGQKERHTKKLAFLREAHRRAAALVKTRPLSLLQRLHVMEEILAPLDATLTGTESLPDASASIDAVLQAWMADWEAQDAAEAARRQEEWMELVAVILAIIAGVVIYVKAPEIFNWLVKTLWPESADNSGSTGTSPGEAPSTRSDQQTPIRPVKRVRRPSQPSAPDSTSSSSNADRENPFP